MHGFFDTDLHQISSHFATAAWVICSNDRAKLSFKETIQSGFLFLIHLKSTYNQLILSKSPLTSLSRNLSSTIAVTAHCFGAPSVRVIGHCMIGQKHDLLWPYWPNLWVSSSVRSTNFRHSYIPGTQGQVWDDISYVLTDQGALLITWIIFHPGMDVLGKVWNEITYPFLNFNWCTIDVWWWIAILSDTW